MSLSVKSAFIYGFYITELNYTLDIDEGSGEVQCNLSPKSYSISEMAIEIERALNEAGTLDYTVILDRDTRKFTISASANFEILSTTGTRVGLGCYDLIGFNGADKTGDDEYEGNVAGEYWEPQNVIEEYISPEYVNEKIEPSINESGSGIIESIFFGDRKVFEGVFRLITNKAQNASRSKLLNDPNGIENAIAFMQYATQKLKFEFIPDKSDPDTFYKCILESTDGDSSGTSYTLEKEFDEGVKGYYTLGKLKFRVVS